MLCDHFPGRLPSEVLSEVARLPVGMLDDILEAKGYMQAKHMVDAADTAEARQRLPQTAIFDLVNEIEFERAAEELKKKRG